MTSKRSFAGSHPEEHYVPATRKRMFLDRPTSHGGWPEGEYDPPVADRIYGWYKKMGMMPESDVPEDEDEHLANEGIDMIKSLRGLSGEQKRDAAKQRAGHRIGYLHDPESEALTDEIAEKLISGEMRVSELLSQPHIIRNVLSAIRVAGEYDLAREISDLMRMSEGVSSARYVGQRDNQMRITESALRRFIREELSNMREGDAPDTSNEAQIAGAVITFFNTKKKEFPGQASKVKVSGVVDSARSSLKDRLMNLGVKQADIAATVKKHAPGGDDMGEGAEVAKMK